MSAEKTLFPQNNTLDNTVYTYVIIIIKDVVVVYLNISEALRTFYTILWEIIYLENHTVLYVIKKNTDPFCYYSFSSFLDFPSSNPIN